MLESLAAKHNQSAIPGHNGKRRGKPGKERSVLAGRPQALNSTSPGPGQQKPTFGIHMQCDWRSPAMGDALLASHLPGCGKKPDTVVSDRCAIGVAVGCQRQAGGKIQFPRPARNAPPPARPGRPFPAGPMTPDIRPGCRTPVSIPPCNPQAKGKIRSCAANAGTATRHNKKRKIRRIGSSSVSRLPAGRPHGPVRPVSVRIA